MTDQKDDTPNDIKETDVPESTDSVQSSRRSFIFKGVVTAVPIIVSSVSRPAWGDLAGMPMVCGSAIASGNVSENKELKCQGGLSPGAWRNNFFQCVESFAR